MSFAYSVQAKSQDSHHFSGWNFKLSGQNSLIWLEYRTH